MNLFLDTISPQNTLILFNDQREIIHTHFFNTHGNESTYLIDEVHDFLGKYNIDYYQLENLIFIHGPGSFTGVRITTLMINTINFIIQKNITPLSYFDLFLTYPIVKTSSRRDVFYKADKNTPIEIIPNEDVLKKLGEKKIIYGDFIHPDIQTFSIIDYESLIKNLSFDTQKRAQPLYIKKPNIF